MALAPQPGLCHNRERRRQVQEESIALWRRGKDAWNAWAEDMLRQKAELEKSGSWNRDKSDIEWSDETRKWMEVAEIDLSGLRFMTRALADTAGEAGWTTGGRLAARRR